MYRTTVTQDSAKLCHTCFNKSVLKQLHQKLWKISRKLYTVELYFNNSAIIFTADTFLEMFRKLKPLFVCKTFVPFCPTSQVWCSKFVTSTKTDSHKNVSCECSEIVENLPGKGL